MTDAECAETLRRYLLGELSDAPVVKAAIERAVEVLTPKPSVKPDVYELRSRVGGVLYTAFVSPDMPTWFDPQWVRDEYGEDVELWFCPDGGVAERWDLDRQIHPDVARHIRDVLGPGIGDVLKQTKAVYIAPGEAKS